MKLITKVRRKCSVPGCRNLDCFSISRGSAGAICLCETCTTELHRAYKASAKDEKKKKKEAEREAEVND